MEMGLFIPERYMFVPKALQHKQTVYERIKEMDPDELAAYLAGLTNGRAPAGLGVSWWRDFLDQEINH